MRIRLSKYLISFAFIISALLSIWINSDKIISVVENLLPGLEGIRENNIQTSLNKIAIFEEIKDLQKDTTQHSEANLKELKLNLDTTASFVSYLTFLNQLNIIAEQIHKEDYLEAKKELEKIKLNQFVLAFEMQIDDLMLEISKVETIMPTTLFPNDTGFLAWLGCIIKIRYLATSERKNQKNLIIEKFNDLRAGFYLPDNIQIIMKQHDKTD